MSASQDHASAKADVPDTIPVETIDQFAALVARWHAGKVARIEHLKLAPAGMEVQIGDDPPFKLEDDIRKGYLLGLETALSEIRELPFEAEVEDAPAQQQPEQPSTGG